MSDGGGIDLSKVIGPPPTGLERLRSADPDQFYDDSDGGLGFLPMTAASYVRDALELGWDQNTQKFFGYADGVWSQADSLVKRGIGALLGNRFRPGHRDALMGSLLGLSTLQDVDPARPPDTSIINLSNGMFEWATGTLLPHDKSRVGTVKFPVEYDPTATCPHFDQFIIDVTSSPEVAELLWDVIAYALYHGNPFQKAIMLHGPGGNGKGRLLRVLSELVGRNNVSAVPLQALSDNRFRVATLYGRQLNIAGDLKKEWVKDTAVFKGVTGGDTVQGEHKFGHPFDFKPWAVPFFAANYSIGSDDTSDGYWRRWIVIPMPHDFEGSGRSEEDIDAANLAELPGILTKALLRLPKLMAAKQFDVPVEALKAKDEFRKESDWIRAWLDEGGWTIEPQGKTLRTEVYAAFRYWVQTEGGDPMSSRTFYSKVRAVHGVDETRTAKGRYITGLRKLPGTVTPVSPTGTDQDIFDL